MIIAAGIVTDGPKASMAVPIKVDADGNVHIAPEDIQEIVNMIMRKLKDDLPIQM